jgi:hypothetical protein
MIDGNEYEQMFILLEKESYKKCHDLIPLMFDDLCKEHVNICKNRQINKALEFSLIFQSNYNWITNAIHLNVYPRIHINNSMNTFENVKTQYGEFAINIKQIWEDYATKLKNNVRVGFAIIQLSKNNNVSTYIDAKYHFQQAYDDFKIIESNNNDASFRLKVMKSDNDTDIFFILFLDYYVDDQFYFSDHSHVDELCFDSYFTHLSRWINPFQTNNYNNAQIGHQHSINIFNKLTNTQITKQEIEDLKKIIEDLKLYIHSIDEQLKLASVQTVLNTENISSIENKLYHENNNNKQHHKYCIIS